jgi:hypothetical protein
MKLDTDSYTTRASAPRQGADTTPADEAVAPAQLVVGAVLGAPGGGMLLVAPCHRCDGEHFYNLDGFRGLRPERGERLWALCDAPGPAGPAGPPGACGRCARIVPSAEPAVYYDRLVRASPEGQATMRRLRRLGFPTSHQVHVPRRRLQRRTAR